MEDVQVCTPPGLKRTRAARSASIDSTATGAPDDQASEASSDKHRKLDYFPATRLFEYQWPLGNDGAEFYILQEQVKEFLDIRGIQRKYPDISRRNVELDERKYLMGRGVVTETQSNMGLVALRSEEVLELMAEDYPDKFQEYQSVLQEREFQATLRKKMMESKRVAFMAEAQQKVGNQVTSEAIKSVVSFNSQLARSRRLAGHEYADSQTKLKHVPRHPQVVQAPPPMSRYPAALLPGQYCDYVPHFSPSQLKRLPLNTVIDMPREEKSMEAGVPRTSTSLTTSSFLSSLFSIPTASRLQPLIPASSVSTPSSSHKPNISLSSSILSAILSKLPSLPKSAVNTTTTTAPQTTMGSKLESKQQEEHSHSTTTVAPLNPIPNLASPGTGLEQKEVGLVHSQADSVATGKEKTIPENNPALVSNPSCSGTVTDGKILEQSDTAPTETSLNEQNLETQPSNDSKPKLVQDREGVIQNQALRETEEGQSLPVKDGEFVAKELEQEGTDGESKIPPTTTAEESSSTTITTPVPPSSEPHPLNVASSLPVPKRKVGKVKVCSVCFKGSSCNKFGQPEEMLNCSYCKARVHPSCYDLSKKAVSTLKGYPWQCLECKSCQLCSNPDREEQMMCCDQCDRGYHSFCVGLSDIPAGQWLCSLCSKCASCGRGFPTSSGTNWMQEYHKGEFLQTLCLECSSYFRRGYFCPVCLKVYHDDETDSPMVCCDNCDRWIHTECDGISAEQYRKFSSEDSATYICCLCRGNRPERIDKYHKKYKQNVS